MMKKILTAALGLAAVSMGHAASVTGDVKFAVEVPEILVLYHWDTATLTLTGTSENTADTRDHTLTAALASGATYNINENAVLTTSSTNGTGNVTVNLVNSWGVRSIAATDPTLTLAAPGSTLSNGNETITISDATLSCTTASNCTASAGDTVQTIDKGWAVKTGNIQFDMDLSNLTESGTYSTSNSNATTFTLTFATP